MGYYENVEFHPTHIHKSSGKMYQFMFTTNVKASKPDFIMQAVYRDETLKLWSRPYEEFEQKFTMLDNLKAEQIKAIYHILENPNDVSDYRLNRDMCVKDIRDGKDFFFCKNCGALEYAHYCHYDSTLKPKKSCFKCNFWIEKYDTSKNKNVFIIKHHFYSDGGNKPNERNKSVLGHSGSKFVILKDNNVTETNNLWSAGIIPEQFWWIMPDNAVLLEQNKSKAVVDAAEKLKLGILKREV